MFDLSRRLASEALGTLLLVATVVGSGIMGDRLTNDTALILLGNTLPTGAVLVVLITLLGPISGAHFNPVVSMVEALRGVLPPREAWAYAVSQIIGGIAGTLVAHAMFATSMLQVSATVRSGADQWFAEGVATFGLLVTILLGSVMARGSVAWLVGLYITAAYWFTASTSFANPAVTIARAFSDSFAGIRPLDVPGFVAAQIAGALAALAFSSWLLTPLKKAQDDSHHLSQP